MNLDKMSLSDLKGLEAQVAAAIATHDKRKKEEALNAIAATAKEFGFTLKELLGSAPPKAATRGPAKFAHPDNPRLSWTGHGRQPAWFREAIAKGASRESLAV